MSSLLAPLRRAGDAWLPDLVAHLWSSTLFLLLVLVVVFLMRHRLTASARFALALIGILKFAIPGGLLSFPAARPAALELPIQVLGGAFPLPSPPVRPSLWPAMAIAVWLAVAIFLMLRFALTRHRLVALSMKTALPPHSREVEALSRARRRVGVRRSIDIARSALPEAPAVLRILRPVVVLPAAGCEDLSDDELESLLCHECAHVARHDNLIARIESVICALFWFHPLIWIAQRITVIERERACDEVVAGSADERETYLTALTKFCHAAIAPRLPGVSCMATAKLKERMDHVMNYETLKAEAPSTRRVSFIATAALVLFTVASAIIGGDRAFAGASKRVDPYAVRITAARTGEAVAVQATVTENATRAIIATPRLLLDASHIGSTRVDAGDTSVLMEVNPAELDWISIAMTIEKLGQVVKSDTVRVKVLPGTETVRTETTETYTGAPISLTLVDADLRDLIGTFGKLTGVEMRVDDSVQGKVSVNWHNVPWDEAFDTMLKENGLKYEIRNKVMYISKN